MRVLIDYLTKKYNRLVYRVLVWTGTPESNLKAWLSAVNAKERDIALTDKKLRGKVNIVQVLIALIASGLAIFTIIKIRKK